MLKTVKWFALGLVVAAFAVGYFAYTRHIVRTEDGTRIVKKTDNTFEHIYVDSREWGPLDHLSHPAAKALRADDLQRAKDAAKEAYDDARDQVKKGLDDASKQIDKTFK